MDVVTEQHWMELLSFYGEDVRPSDSMDPAGPSDRGRGLTCIQARLLLPDRTNGGSSTSVCAAVAGPVPDVGLELEYWRETNGRGRPPAASDREAGNTQPKQRGSKRGGKADLPEAVSEVAPRIRRHRQAAVVPLVQDALPLGNDLPKGRREPMIDLSGEASQHAEDITLPTLPSALFENEDPALGLSAGSTCPTTSCQLAASGHVIGISGGPPDLRLVIGVPTLQTTPAFCWEYLSQVGGCPHAADHSSVLLGVSQPGRRHLERRPTRDHTQISRIGQGPVLRCCIQKLMNLPPSEGGPGCQASEAHIRGPGCDGRGGPGKRSGQVLAHYCCGRRLISPPHGPQVLPLS